MIDYRPSLDKIKPYSVEEKAWEIKVDANESPYNLPPLVRERALSRLEYLAFNRYPEMGMLDLRGQIAQDFGLKLENVVIGSGSSEILAALCYAFGGTDRGIVFPVPSFSMYGVYAGLSDSVALPVVLNEDYSVPREKMLEAAQQNGKLIIICNPNNPTGTATSLEDIEYILQKAKCPVVVDEAYYEFHGESAAKFLGKYKNLIIARTFSKAYGLASARVGYMLADEELTAVVEKALMPYHVNALSLAVAEIVYQMRDEFTPIIKQLVLERERLFKALQAIPGIQVFASATNFLLLKGENAGEISRCLEENSIGIRSFGNAPYLENCIRITVGTPQENDTTLNCIKQCIEGNK